MKTPQMNFCKLANLKWYVTWPPFQLKFSTYIQDVDFQDDHHGTNPSQRPIHITDIQHLVSHRPPIFYLPGCFQTFASSYNNK